jgi:hypothetical protein
MMTRLRERDCLVTMVEALRAARPRIYEVERFRLWAASFREAVQALPRLEQRWASVVLAADDLAGELPGAPVGMTFGWLSRQLLTDDDLAQMRTAARKAVQR